MLSWLLSNTLFSFILVMHNVYFPFNVIASFCQDKYYIELIRGSCATGMLPFAVLLITITLVFVRIYSCIGLKAYALALKGNFAWECLYIRSCAIVQFFNAFLFLLIDFFPFRNTFIFYMEQSST